MKQPLAFRLRPTKLDEIIGQKHLLGENMVFRKCIENKRLFSMIFSGPPGTGKTTLAMCLAQELELPYKLINAVTSTKKDLDTIFEQAKYYNGFVLIIDEVHRLNKDKQDLLLPHVENGTIILIGATTSNPYFAINPAIRSRCHIFEIKPLNDSDIAFAIKRALNDTNGLNGEYSIDDDALEIITKNCGGDLRYALNVLEICAIASDSVITKETVLQYSNKVNSSISSGDDGHYDAVSAFQKSIRGSDVQAALYYLARLIQAYDMDSIERRLLVIAYEDVGLGNPAAVGRVISGIDAAKRVGFPEAMIPLSVVVTDLCLSPKSKTASNAIHEALDLVNKTSYAVPDYLRLTPISLNTDEKYDYGRADLWPLIQYLPTQIKNVEFYVPENTSQYEKQLGINYYNLKKTKRSNNLKQLKIDNKK